MCALPRHYLTPEEYLAMERQAPTKSEYLRGEVFAMAGASFAHNMIASNTLVSLVPQLKRRSCTAHSSDLRVNVRATRFLCLPRHRRCLWAAAIRGSPPGHPAEPDRDLRDPVTFHRGF